LLGGRRAQLSLVALLGGRRAQLSLVALLGGRRAQLSLVALLGGRWVQVVASLVRQLFVFLAFRLPVLSDAQLLAETLPPNQAQRLLDQLSSFYCLLDDGWLRHCEDQEEYHFGDQEEYHFGDQEEYHFGDQEMVNATYDALIYHPVSQPIVRSWSALKEEILLVHSVSNWLVFPSSRI
jgi:hypothetical protein